jgi:membrane fusion protein (multidrug efflux system)
MTSVIPRSPLHNDGSVATAVSEQQSPPAPLLVEPAAPPPSSRRRRLFLPILALAVIAGSIWGIKKWSYGRAHESTDNAQVDGHLVPVLAKVGGFVTSVRVGENVHVNAGAELVHIDDSEYKVRLAQANADLAAAVSVAGSRGVTGQAEAQVQTAASQRQVVDAQIAAAEANRQKAVSDLARMRELADKQIVSRQQLDAAQAAADAAIANETAVRRQASAAGSSVVNAEAGARFAQARLVAANAARDNAALQLSYTSVTAPLSGIVSRKQVEVGQLVQPGQPLLTVVGDTGVWVTANFKETQLAQVRVGNTAEIDVDAYPGCKAEGTVESIGAATGAKFALLPPDNATGNFTKVVQRVPVRIAVTHSCGPDRPLRPGMSVFAHVATTR